MPHGSRVPIEGDILLTPGAPGPGQGGPPAPVSGFGPRQRAKRLLRQAAGLQPPSDVQPRSSLHPAIEAALNLQLEAGLLSREKFEARTRPPTSGAGPEGPAARPPSGARQSLRRSARRARAARQSLLPSASPVGHPFFGGPVFANENLRRRRTF
jgi:hypothetical protein